MVAPFTKGLGLEGVAGIRVLTHYAGRFYSPVYAHCQWGPGLQIASCAIGCQVVPSTRHMGCGFHAFWDLAEAQGFVEQMRGTAVCLVLIECVGRVVVHEKGLRAEKARVAAVLDWDPTLALQARSARAARSLSVPLAATWWFHVPLVEQSLAREVIEVQRARCEAV
jgi:hypothetical protein